MLIILFSEEAKQALFEGSQHHANPRVRRRMSALYFKSKGLAHNKICDLLNISPQTLISYIKLYQQGGITALTKFGYKGQVSPLTPHKQVIMDSFIANPPRDVQEARHRIEQLTGILLSPSAILNFMKKQGLKYLKTGTIPGGQKANSEEKKKERKEFLINELKPRLKEAENGKRNVLFMDAAHFVFRAYVGFLWCFARIFLPSPSGRKRLNVLGAVDAISKEVIAVSNTTYVNGQTVCELLDKVHQTYKDTGNSITIVLDNARYQKCKIVREKSEQLGIELLYLPSYSPQLNLIERLWKYVKRTCLYARYYEQFEQFSQAILEAINKPKKEQKAKIVSLLVPNFQSFDKVEIRAA